jgi:hypothetical protein
MIVIKGTQQVVGLGDLPDSLKQGFTKTTVEVTDLTLPQQSLVRILWTLQLPSPGGLQWAGILGSNGSLTATVIADVTTLNIQGASHKVEINLEGCNESDQMRQAVATAIIKHWQGKGRQAGGELAQAEQIVSALELPVDEIITRCLASSPRAEKYAETLTEGYGRAGLTFVVETNGPIHFIKVTGPSRKVATIMSLFNENKPVA